MGIAPLPEHRSGVADPGSGHPGLDVVPGPARASARPRRTTRQEPGADLRRRIDGITAVMGGGANIIMQLSWPEVAYGVMESKVHSGSATVRPYKRTRTTLTYIAVALLGDEETRTAYRRAVNKQHVQVRSDADSPVKYNAFNPDLQLWVATCLYVGARDVMTRMHGSLDAETEGAWFAAGARFGTTLQVPEDRWHRDLAELERYWADGLARATMDDRTREYLRQFLDASVFPAPLSILAGPVVRFFNTGFLPVELREELGVEWSPRQERAHRTVVRTLGRVTRPLPDVVRRFPFNALLLDVRVRRRLGRPLV